MTDLYNDEAWELGEKKNTPLYHKWTFDEDSGSVTIDGREKKDDGGYAIRIDGGWRVVDYDSKPVTDFYIVRQVLEALKNETKVSKGLEDYDFDKLHYGQPLPLNKEQS